MAGLRYPEIDRPIVSDTGRTFQDVKKDEAPPPFFSLPSSQFYSKLNRHFGESLNRNKLVERRNLLSGISLNPGKSRDPVRRRSSVPYDAITKLIVS